MKNMFLSWIIHENSKYFKPTGRTTQLEWKFIKACRENTFYHHVQSGLSLVSETLAQWTEFCSIHTSHPLSFTVFVPLLQKISSAIQEDLVTEEEVGIGCLYTLKSSVLL